MTCQILRLCVNTLSTDEKYPLLNRENLMLPIQMKLSQKEFLNFLPHFWNLDEISNILKKKMTLTTFVFPKLRTLKSWLDKHPKTPVSEDPSTSNMVNVPKHCWNLHHSTFIILSGQSQGNCNRKSLSYWHSKSWESLLADWLPMKIILFFIGTM